MSTVEAVLAALEEVTGESEVRGNLDLPLFEYHLLDSLRTVQLLAMLSDRFQVDIALSEVDRQVWATPGRVIRFMEEHVPR